MNMKIESYSISDRGKTQICLVWDKWALSFHGCSCKQYLTTFALLLGSGLICRLWGMLAWFNRRCSNAGHQAGPRGRGSDVPSGHVCSRHRSEPAAFPCSASSAVCHCTWTGYGSPQEKHLLPV